MLIEPDDDDETGTDAISSVCSGGVVATAGTTTAPPTTTTAKQAVFFRSATTATGGVGDATTTAAAKCGSGVGQQQPDDMLLRIALDRAQQAQVLRTRYDSFVVRPPEVIMDCGGGGSATMTVNFVRRELCRRGVAMVLRKFFNEIRETILLPLEQEFMQDSKRYCDFAKSVATAGATATAGGGGVNITVATRAAFNASNRMLTIAQKLCSVGKVVCATISKSIAHRVILMKKVERDMARLAAAAAGAASGSGAAATTPSAATPADDAADDDDLLQRIILKFSDEATPDANQAKLYFRNYVQRLVGGTTTTTATGATAATTVTVQQLAFQQLLQQFSLVSSNGLFAERENQILSSFQCDDDKDNDVSSGCDDDGESAPPLAPPPAPAPPASAPAPSPSSLRPPPARRHGLSSAASSVSSLSAAQLHFHAARHAEAQRHAAEAQRHAAEAQRHVSTVMAAASATASVTARSELGSELVQQHHRNKTAGAKIGTRVAYLAANQDVITLPESTSSLHGIVAAGLYAMKSVTECPSELVRHQGAEMLPFFRSHVRKMMAGKGGGGGDPGGGDTGVAALTEDIDASSSVGGGGVGGGTRGGGRGGRGGGGSRGGGRGGGGSRGRGSGVVTMTLAQTAAVATQPSSVFDRDADDAQIRRQLFNGLMMNSCSTVGVNGEGNSDTAIALRLAEIFNEKSLYSSGCNQILLSVLCPLVSEERMKPQSSSWLEIGRAIATTYRDINGYTDVGLAVWKEYTAQKLFLSKVRSWFQSSSKSSTAAAASAAIEESSFLVGSDFFQFIRGGVGEDDDHHSIAAAAATAARRNPHLACIYSLDSGDTFGASNSHSAMQAIAKDVFMSRAFGHIYDVIASARDASSCHRLPIPTGETFSMITSIFVNFFTDYRLAMQAVHAETATAATAGAATTAGGGVVARAAMDVGQIIRQSSCGAVAVGKNRHIFHRKRTRGRTPDVVDVAGVMSPSAGAAATRRHPLIGYSSPTAAAAPAAAAAASTTEFAREIRKEVVGEQMAMIEQQFRAVAQRDVDIAATPEDFEWNQTQVRNCMGMFIHCLKNNDLLVEVEKHRRKRIQEVVDNRFPELAPAIASCDMDTFMSLLAVMTTQEEINVAIGLMLDKIISTDVDELCASTWDTFDDTERLTIRTIGGYARDDSPNEYERWHELWVLDALYLAAKEQVAREAAIGRFAARVLWQRYVVVPTESMTGASSAAWYRMEHGRHHLKKLNGTSRLIEDLEKYVIRIVDNVLRKATEESDRTERKVRTLLQRASSCGGSRDLADRIACAHNMTTNIITPLKEIKKMIGGRGRSSIIEAIRSCGLLTCPLLNDLKNQQECLMAFNNGVVDMSAADNRIIFRAGKIEDFITMTTGISMPIGGRITALNKNSKRTSRRNLFSDDHPDVVFLDNYWNKVFPDKELQRFTWLDCASFFYGRNETKHLRVGPGTSNNSKTIFTKMFQRAFGKYAIDIPAEALASKAISNPSGPSPELAQGDGARLAFMTEPSGGMEFDVGLVKRMTGGDRTFSRGLHENGSSKILSFKVWISCNDIPAMSGFDDATKQRVLIIPFLSTWCKNAPSDPEEQMKQRRFPIDKYFEQNHINRLARALVWKLFHLYDESKQRDPDAPLPKVICDYVDTYWSSVDAYLSFHKEMIEEAPGAVLTMSEIFVAFGIWYAERNGGSPGGGGGRGGGVASYEKVKLNFCRKDRLGPFQNDKRSGKSSWIGYRIKSPAAAAAADDAAVAADGVDAGSGLGSAAAVGGSVGGSV